MLRQLARLTRPLPAAGPGALAVTIYETPAGAVHANESGFEGVTCVDDAARLLGVVCDVWERTELPWVQRWARGLLQFVLWMQEPDGYWLNFVHDWDGDKNSTGITSRSGQNFWQARAIVAVERAAHALDDDAAREAYRRGLARAAEQEAPPDIRSLHLVAALRGAQRGDASATPIIRAWANELIACRDGVVLKNSAYEVGAPHLWAHLQEGVLATAGTVLNDRALVEAAAASADVVVIPAIEHAFAGRSMAYEVSSCVEVADRLYAATGERRWADAAGDARAWFDGRNAAGAPTYDPETGRVADGIDEDRVSRQLGRRVEYQCGRGASGSRCGDRACDGRPLRRSVTATLIAAVAIVAFAAATQSITGFGFALIVVPGLTVLAGPKVAVVAMTSIGVPLVAWNAVRWRADLQVREALTVTVAALVGMPIGILVLTRADDRVLTAVIGVTILAMTLWLWRGLHLPHGRRTEVIAGITSGALATSVGTNGPPLVIAFQAVDMPPAPFRATLQACFFAEGLVALALFWSQGLFVHDVGALWLVGVPATVVGALIGDRIAPRVHDGPFRAAVLWLLALSGVLALANAVRS